MKEELKIIEGKDDKIEFFHKNLKKIQEHILEVLTGDLSTEIFLYAFLSATSRAINNRIRKAFGEVGLEIFKTLDKNSDEDTMIFVLDELSKMMKND